MAKQKSDNTRNATTDTADSLSMDSVYPKPVRANDDPSTTTTTDQADFDASAPNSDGGPAVTPTRHLMEEELLRNNDAVVNKDQSAEQGTNS